MRAAVVPLRFPEFQQAPTQEVEGSGAEEGEAELLLQQRNGKKRSWCWLYASSGEAATLGRPQTAPNAKLIA